MVKTTHMDHMVIQAIPYIGPTFFHGLSKCAASCWILEPGSLWIIPGGMEDYNIYPIYVYIQITNRQYKQ